MKKFLLIALLVLIANPNFSASQSKPIVDLPLKPNATEVSIVKALLSINWDIESVQRNSNPKDQYSLIIATKQCFYGVYLRSSILLNGGRLSFWYVKKPNTGSSDNALKEELENVFKLKDTLKSYCKEN